MKVEHPRCEERDLEHVLWMIEIENPTSHSSGMESEVHVVQLYDTMVHEWMLFSSKHTTHYSYLD